MGAWSEGEAFNENLYGFCKAESEFVARVFEGRFVGTALSEWIDILSKQLEEANEEIAKKFILETNITVAIEIYSYSLPELHDEERQKWIANQKDEFLVYCLKNKNLNEFFNIGLE
tara:strand:+ start:163 stop:510 length:348 start_codon:yes stop_codon:yes gene_type:complete